MSINLLPVFSDEEEQRKVDALTPPETIVVRYGYMRQIGEYPYIGKEIPGCGTKLVARTDRGVELAEMLTTTCGNAGCGSSISRKQMLEYIDNSGGKQYPFSEDGKVLRVASVEDLNEQARLETHKPEFIRSAKQAIQDLDLQMKLIEAEPLLSGERVVFYFMAEGRVDFRELVRRLAGELKTRIEMRQVGARDEGRLTADFNKCGQHCCCKQFLKVLKPVSMRSAKIQKATLDPTKISGRCGRLMCCLRYEDETYDDLRKRLPHRRSMVITPDGPGMVISSQVLTQLVLVELIDKHTRSAYPVENLEKMTPEQAKEAEQMKRDRQAERAERAEAAAARAAARPRRPEPRRPRPGTPMSNNEVRSREDEPSAEIAPAGSEAPPPADTTPPPSADTTDTPGTPGTDDKPSAEQEGSKRKRRGRRGRGRRGRRRRRPGDNAGGGSDGTPDGGSGGPDSGSPSNN